METLITLLPVLQFWNFQLIWPANILANMAITLSPDPTWGGGSDLRGGGTEPPQTATLQVSFRGFLYDSGGSYGQDWPHSSSDDPIWKGKGVLLPQARKSQVIFVVFLYDSEGTYGHDGPTTPHSLMTLLEGGGLTTYRR